MSVCMCVTFDYLYSVLTKLLSAESSDTKIYSSKII